MPRNPILWPGLESPGPLRTSERDPGAAKRGNEMGKKTFEGLSTIRIAITMRMPDHKLWILARMSDVRAD
jgi:hypothetical protein